MGENYEKRYARSNKSLDVRAKQRLCYERRPLNLKLREGGFARVNSSDIGKKIYFHLNFAFNAFLFISATDKMITPMPIHWVGATFS